LLPVSNSCYSDGSETLSEYMSDSEDVSFAESEPDSDPVTESEAESDSES